MEVPYIGLTQAQAYDAIGAGKTYPLGPIGLFQAAINGITGGAIATTTAPALYNPPGSGKLVRILLLNYGDESGTIIRSHIRHYWQPNPILSGLTAGSIQSRNGVVSVCSFYTALTVAAAATLYMPAGIGSGGAIAAQFYWMQSFAEGVLTVQPGELFYPYVSNAAMAMVATVGMVWLETPIPTGN